MHVSAHSEKKLKLLAPMDNNWIDAGKVAIVCTLILYLKVSKPRAHNRTGLRKRAAQQRQGELRIRTQARNALDAVGRTARMHATTRA